jgi:hypothetical protein
LEGREAGSRETGVRIVIAGLPYDAEVDYLESTGTQWIDTGVIPSADFGCHLEIAHKNNFGMCGATGTSLFVGGGSYAIYISGQNTDSVSSVQYCFGTTVQTVSNIAVPKNTRISWELNWMNDKHLTIGNIVDVPCVSPVFFQQYKFTVMHLNVADNQNNNNFYITGRLYGIKLSRGLEVIHDSIPVRFTNEQGVSEGAMYDRLGVGGMNPDGSPRTDGLYRNRGTGVFVFPTA